MQFSSSRIFSILCICVSSLALLPPTRLQAAEMNKQPYPPEVVKTFTKGCQYKMKKEECTCAIKAIQAKYTFAEFKKIDDDARVNHTAPKDVQAIFQTCRQKKK
jgi:hypothetical protein